VFQNSPKTQRTISIVFSTILLVGVMSMAARASTVTLTSGQSIQAAVNNNPAGTTFEIPAGTYRQQSIVPKSGDVFIGAAGADLNGSMVVTGFTHNTFWVAHVGISAPASLPGKCFSWAPMCQYPEDLYVDNTLYHRVSSLSVMSSNHWYLDYSNGNVYLMDDPTGHTVEITTTPYAFSGNANNVTIKGLLIEKYGAPGQTAAIFPENAAGDNGSDWIVENNEIRYNHGAGVEATTGMQILSNRIHNNGELGIAGCGDNILVESNNINFNNTDGYDYGFGAGGAKFDRTTNLVVRSNYVTGNYGAGLHSDTYSYNTLYEYNTTSNNKVAGIQYEISTYGVIRYNTITNDGYNPQGSGPWWGSGIYNLNSSNVEVYNNTVTNCMHGIVAADSLRVGENGAVLEVSNFSVHDNVVTQQTGVGDGVLTLATGDAIYTSWGNQYSNNTYNLPSQSGLYFYWMDKNLDYAGWEGYGQN